MWDILFPDKPRPASGPIDPDQSEDFCLLRRIQPKKRPCYPERGTSGHGTLAKTRDIGRRGATDPSAGHFNSCLIIFLRLGLQSQRHLEIPAPPAMAGDTPQYRLAGDHTVLEHG